MSFWNKKKQKLQLKMVVAHAALFPLLAPQGLHSVVHSQPFSCTHNKGQCKKILHWSKTKTVLEWTSQKLQLRMLKNDQKSKLTFWLVMFHNMLLWWNSSPCGMSLFVTSCPCSIVWHDVFLVAFPMLPVSCLANTKIALLLLKCCGHH